MNPEGDPPFPSRVTLVDVMGGLIACEGILAALLTRERTGRGCSVETSLLSSAMVMQAPVLEAMATATERGRRGGRPEWSILDRPLRTGAGFLALAVDDAVMLDQLARLCEVGPAGVGCAERIVERLRARPSTEWELLLTRGGVPAAAVCESLADLPGDARVAKHLEWVEDACWLPAAPWGFVS